MAALRALVLLSAAVAVAGSSFVLKKCCSEYTMLDADGSLCVAAPWPRNASLNTIPTARTHLVPPHDAAWLRHWLPPGVSAAELDARGAEVWLLKNDPLFALQQRLNASALAPNDGDSHNSDQRKDVAVFDKWLVRRARPSGGFRMADYCVDAARPPLGPFVLRFWTYATLGDRVYKCCIRRRLLVSRPSGVVFCARDPRAWWTPPNSTRLARLDPEMPYDVYTGHNLAAEVFRVDSSLSEEHFLKILSGEAGAVENLFSTWMKPCVDFYRGSDGHVQEVIGYRYYHRPARGAYWLSRNFSFASILLLAASLASIRHSARMRKTVHGWALACHAACLLLFNCTQVLYYVTISKDVDDVKTLPDHFRTPCLIFGFTAYFLLTAGGCWLTAVCINMAHGFRLKQRRAASASSKRTFAWLSAFAWGTAVAFTSACAVGVASSARSSASLPWHQPSLAETRTCFFEMSRDYPVRSVDRGSSVKWGTLLYFYGPMCSLLLANVGALGLTARRVHFLRRGNSLLRRDEREAQRAKGDARGRGAQATGSDPQSIVVYLKLLLSAGSVELMTETVAWAMTWHGFETGDSDAASLFLFLDHTYAYRCAGYCADLLRALIVLWLCAPDRASLRAFWKRLRLRGAEREARREQAGQRRIAESTTWTTTEAEH